MMSHLCRKAWARLSPICPRACRKLRKSRIGAIISVADAAGRRAAKIIAAVAMALARRLQAVVWRVCAVRMCKSMLMARVRAVRMGQRKHRDKRRANAMGKAKVRASVLVRRKASVRNRASAAISAAPAKLA